MAFVKVVEGQLIYNFSIQVFVHYSSFFGVSLSQIELLEMFGRRSALSTKTARCRRVTP
jgi:hypothetical protein